MHIDLSNINFKLAFDFVNDTNCSIYLSGKAGTGKTTFLQYVKLNCRKNMVVLAPTGVAAINAGGVTLHSFFQLPFGPFLPDVKTGFGLNDGVVDKNRLFQNLKLNSSKRKLIDELELIIIDEVSMLRSDTLDAIDTILKAFRKSSRPFGGVQVLFIGDLYQLPPVVNDAERNLLDEYYQSPFFFDAKVLEVTQLVYIELNKIYRQKEQEFIDLLNKLRHNCLVESDYAVLNQRYQPERSEDASDTIILTTHNRKADTINNEALRQLPGKTHVFKGQIKGDFGEKQLPTELMLELKEGAQVMFVKNDSSPDKKYYNGKIAVVSSIRGDEVYVRFLDTKEEYQVKADSWENINYTLNKESKTIDEKVVGEFIQRPLRLAWAITIHKSQGLTFDQVIIDAGQSFAPGQVYVALSRCTSLNGVLLHSRISPQAVYTEPRIVDFAGREMQGEILQVQLAQEKGRYQSEQLIKLFQFQRLLNAMYELEEATLLSKNLPDPKEAVTLLRQLIKKAEEQKRVADKFIQQIETLLQGKTNSDQALLKDRVGKGIHYFMQLLHKEILIPLYDYLQSIKAVAKLKKYNILGVSVYQQCWQKLEDLQEATLHEVAFVESWMKIPRQPLEAKVAKIEKGSSPKESLAYFVSGKSVAEVATLRNLAVSTIETHLSEFIKTGELEIARFLSMEQVDEIKRAYLRRPGQQTKDLKLALNDRYSYSELRMALNHLIYSKEL